MSQHGYQLRIPRGSRLSAVLRHDIEIVSQVFPFKVNQYVVDNLIDWEQAPNDPIFRMLFPVKEMLPPEEFEKLAALKHRNATQNQIRDTIARIRAKLNPHPSGQVEHNTPMMGDKPLHGVQHKYAETILLFPKHGQSCHSHCTFCFRWAQFIDEQDLTIALDDIGLAMEYIAQHPLITDIVITGGDPMVMSTRRIREFIEPFLGDRFEHIKNIRIGTKAITFAPHRFVTSADADDLMRLFEQARDADKRIAMMLHLNHPRELEPQIAHQAIARLLNAGVILRSQAPLLARVNDSGRIWENMWRQHVKMGISPYYMFVERDTGAYRYFSVPLWRAHRIFHEAITSVSGLSRTCRGPVMSALNGKVEIMGTMNGPQGPVFILRYIQARSPHFAYTPFLAKFDRSAKWLTDLSPVNSSDAFYFSDDVWPPTYKQEHESPIIRFSRRKKAVC